MYEGGKMLNPSFTFFRRKMQGLFSGENTELIFILIQIRHTYNLGFSNTEILLYFFISSQSTNVF